jgi:asparagine synthase (glutamine-hydrolysing)
MSGICAVWRKDNPERLGPALAAVSRGLTLHAEERIEREDHGGVGIAVSARFATQQVYQNSQVMLACDADLLNEDELRGSVGDNEAVPNHKRKAALLVALYERFGSGFVEKLRGNFSFILWDRRERTLLAAVDGFGVNRLVYYQDKAVVLIGSRIDALLRCDEVPREINPRAVANILNFSASLAPETIFNAVHRLPPGILLRISDGRTHLEKYWDMCYGVGHDSNEGRLSRELETTVQQAVAAQCKSDPQTSIGAFLSGGTDSSTIAGMMVRAGGGLVKTFSIGYEEQQFNELGYAEIAAKRFNTDHHTYLVSAADCLDALPHMVRFFDEPFGNSSAIPTYFCARLAAHNGVNVMLAGDGGDELFGGNERYATDKAFQIYHNVPRVLRRLLEPVVAGFPIEPSLIRRARGYIRRANMPGVERMLSFQFLQTHPPVEVFEGDFMQALGKYSPIEVPSRHYAQASARDHLDRLLYVDLKITLADNDLPKVTSMSELAGVQTRFPFLDRSVAEFSGRIPAGLKVKGFDKRYLFKKAFRNLLPAEIIRKKKHGFGIPVARWMTADKNLRELAHDTLLSSRTFNRGYFRRDFIENLFRKHETDSTTYYGDNLWTFLTLELWHRQVVDNAVELMA